MWICFCQYLVLKQDVHDFACCLRNAGAGSEDSCYACLVEEVVVLGWNHTSGNDENVLTTQFLQLFDKLRNQSLVTGASPFQKSVYPCN